MRSVASDFPVLFRRFLLLTVMIAGSVPVRLAHAQTATLSDSRVQDAPANTWVKLTEETSGGRDWPMFYFDPALNRFVLSAGGFEGPAHFDTELFDPHDGEVGQRISQGYALQDRVRADRRCQSRLCDTGVLKPDPNGVNRILRSLNPYLREPGTYFQWAYSPDDRKLFAYFMDSKLAVDPKLRQWTDLKAVKFSKSAEFPLVYSSLPTLGFTTSLKTFEVRLLEPKNR